jgi:hypothetical protein
MIGTKMSEQYFEVGDILGLSPKTYPLFRVRVIQPGVVGNFKYFILTDSSGNFPKSDYLESSWPNQKEWVKMSSEEPKCDIPDYLMEEYEREDV